MVIIKTNNLPGTPYIGNGPVQRVKVEESIRRNWVVKKWVKYCDTGSYRTLDIMTVYDIFLIYFFR